MPVAVFFAGVAFFVAGALVEPDVFFAAAFLPVAVLFAGVAFFAAGAFVAADVLDAVVFVAGAAFFAGAFFAGAFFAGAFFAGAFFAAGGSAEVEVAAALVALPRPVTRFAAAAAVLPASLAALIRAIVMPSRRRRSLRRRVGQLARPGVAVRPQPAQCGEDMPDLTSGQQGSPRGGPIPRNRVGAVGRGWQTEPAYAR